MYLCWSEVEDTLRCVGDIKWNQFSKMSPIYRNPTNWLLLTTTITTLSILSKSNRLLSSQDNDSGSNNIDPVVLLRTRLGGPICIYILYTLFYWPISWNVCRYSSVDILEMFIWEIFLIKSELHFWNSNNKNITIQCHTIPYQTIPCHIKYFRNEQYSFLKVGFSNLA